jgi:single-strand DNA-binding protein
MSHNRATLMGHVGQDPDVRTNTQGDKFASFSLATSETWKDKTTGERKDQTEWHRIVVYNPNIAGVVEQYVKKGSRVLVEGQIKTRTYTDKDGIERKITEIVVGRFDGKLSLEGSPQPRNQDEHSYGTTTTKPAAGAQPKQTFARDLDDEVPF